MGFKLTDQLDGLVAAGTLRDDIQVILAVDHIPDALPEEGVVIYNYDFDYVHLCPAVWVTRASIA